MSKFDARCAWNQWLAQGRDSHTREKSRTRELRISHTSHVTRLSNLELSKPQSLSSKKCPISVVKFSSRVCISIYDFACANHCLKWSKTVEKSKKSTCKRLGRLIWLLYRLHDMLIRFLAINPSKYLPPSISNWAHRVRGVLETGEICRNEQEIHV